MRTAAAKIVHRVSAMRIPATSLPRRVVVLLRTVVDRAHRRRVPRVDFLNTGRVNGLIERAG